MAAAATIPYDGYLSKQNRPLYDDFVQKKDELHAGQTHLDELRQERVTRIEELSALKNRLMSVDHTRDINSIPRVQAMTRPFSNSKFDRSPPSHPQRSGSAQPISVSQSSMVFIDHHGCW